MLAESKKVSQRLRKESYLRRYIPEHPVHETARLVRNEYSEAVQTAKIVHWIAWLEGLGSINPNEVWAAGKMVAGGSSDGGRARVPTLKVLDPLTRKVSEAVTNKEKSDAFYREFFPPKMLTSSVPQDAIFPPPAFKWQPISDVLLHRVIARMKPYKATRVGSFPNCVYVYNASLLVPFYGAIYRALDALEYYPLGWNLIDSIVLRKPGKANYTDASAFRPICLTVGDARLYHSAKTAQLTTESERAGILPRNHYG
ncbi:hypothetical protein C8R44DRAFT_620418, partial [Mycena epipterygia]